MLYSHTRHQQTYDHRLRDLVRTTGDPDILAEFGVPRSTALGWLRRDYQPVVTADVLDMDHIRLQAEVLKLRQRNRTLAAIIRLLLALVRALGGRLEGRRLPEGSAKAGLLRAVELTEAVLSRRGALRVLGLSASRYHRWRQAERSCGLDDRSTCPRLAPTRLTPAEILAMKEMVESPEYRHVPTGRLAVLAQRLGKVFAAPSTWCKLANSRGWRRPRTRVHPAAPKDGVRAWEADEMWHLDTTIIKLVNGAKIYLHAVIDNYSRKILAWSVVDRFEFATTVTILRDAARGAVSAEEMPTLVTDAGIENVNAGVDELIVSGLLRRVLALRDVSFSNSLIEAWWRSLKHQWLYLNALDSLETVRRLVAFYVEAHNTEIPHSAFRGQTPAEMYYGRGKDVPDKLEAAKTRARAARLTANRAESCSVCWVGSDERVGALAAA